MRISTSRFRRIAAATLAAGLVLAACGGDDSSSSGGSDTTAGGGSFIWTMVTDQAGLGDQGFNDLAYAGLQQAASELGGTAKVIESSEQAQYVPNLLQSVKDGAAMTVGVGFLITDAMVEAATANPDAKFVLIDAVAAGADGTPLSNVQSVTFKEQEAAYLAGIVAGLTTKTGKIGFVGGIEIPPVVRFLKGFEAGVASVNPDATVNIAYVGAFDDPAKGRQITASFYDQGADVVFEVGGLSGVGAYEEAKTRGKGFWVIGTDTCKNQLAPENFLTSATKDVAGAVFRAAKAVADGSFTGGIANLGLAEDGVGVCEKTFSSLPADVQQAVNTARDAIKAGTVTVPES